MEKLVLVVDDEELLEQYIQTVLDQHGYTSASFTDPVKALGFFRHRHDEVEMVITDIKMPGIDGIELARQMMAIEPDIPVVFVSSDADKLNEAKLLGSTRACFMKPVLGSDLVRCVEGLIGRAGASLEGRE
jgi:CheY-like chemotaxis protein